MHKLLKKLSGQIRSKQWLCAIRLHDYCKAYETRIDDFGDGDGIKPIICSRCNKPRNEEYNVELWNQCINIKGTKAYNRIKDIGYNNYCKERKREGEDIWKNF